MASEAERQSQEDPYVPGRVLLGKYELVRPLATGGMGIVWLAHNRVLDVDVAVKLALASGHELSEQCKQRALNEARLAAQLAHPAVCRVLDFGLTEEGDPCVVSELLTGETLDSVLAASGRMAPVAAIQVILPILDALARAHEKGIIHSDVKPSNVFLARDGNLVQPKLLDFGIARGAGESVAAATGTVAGTPCYMSPEQALGSEEIDYRSDLWSASAMLYELLSGAPPFDGDDCADVLARVVEDDVAPLPAHFGSDAALWTILERGLRKNPRERWDSASDLARELAMWLVDRGVEADVCGQSLRARIYEQDEPAISLVGANIPSSIQLKRRRDSRVTSSRTTQVVVAEPVTTRVPRARKKWPRHVVWGSAALLVACLAGAALWRRAPARAGVGLVQSHVNTSLPSGPPERRELVRVAPAHKGRSELAGVPRAAAAPPVPVVSPQLTPSPSKPKREVIPWNRSQLPRERKAPASSASAQPEAPKAAEVERRPQNALGYDFGF